MKSNHKQLNQSRREFFTKLALASLATSLPITFSSCSEKPKFQGSGKAPYKVWEEMLHYIKTSPDYLKGRMEKLTGEGNAEGMFNFIRDEFHLIPANRYGIGEGSQLKWGIDYALRSGMATMWEKAELLHRMYEKAGISSEIVFEQTNITTEESPDFFFKPIERDFLPEISNGMLRQWAKELELKDVQLPLNNVLENEVVEAEELGEKILKSLQLPDDHYYRKFDFRWPNYNTPTVKFQLDGETKYAHLFDPKVPFGELFGGADGKVSKISEATVNNEKVQIKLNYRDSITPSIEKELIGGEWLASDLVGRQLDVQFLNNLSLEEMVVTPAGNVRTFTPALALQAMDKDQKFMEERSILGTPITLNGKKILLDKSGNQKQVGDAVILNKPNPNLIKQVKAVNVHAKTTGYPGVKLSINPTDVNGLVVEGLNAYDFNILEDGKPVKALMESNQQTPRILIMSDTSMSMPVEYSGKGMESFVTDLKLKILEKYPAAIIKFWKTPSSLFTWLLKAAQTENDLIIYATDGDNDDTYDIKNEAVYRNGPPAMVLNVYNSNASHRVNTFERMAEITGGVHLGIDRQTEAIEHVNTYLDNIQIQPYTFTYNSVGDVNERKVTISIDNKRLLANTTYAFENIENVEEIGPKIIGLYLEVKCTNQYPIKRTLAGWEYDIYPKSQPSQKMTDEVNDLMLGSMQFYFEGAGPNYSAIISDVLEARLSTRNWGEPLIDNAIVEAKKAFVNSQFNIDDKALALMTPLQDAVTAQSLTIPGGLRIGLRTFKPGVITEASHSLFDYLNTSNYHTISTDAKKGFSATLKKTAQLAIREKVIFQKSTLSELVDKEWINLKKARENNWFNEHWEENNYYWKERIDRNAHLRIFDKNALSKAFWNIDKDTGELYGYMSNGSGGGQDEDLNNIFTELTLLMAIMGKFGMLHPIGGLALGIVAEYGKTLVKLYAIVSETIMIMDASSMDSKIAEALQKFACEVHVSIIFSMLGKTGELMAGLNTMIGQITGKSVCG